MMRWNLEWVWIYSAVYLILILTRLLIIFLGIHNEAGVVRQKLGPLEKTVSVMLQALLKPFPTTWYPKSGDKVALLVNNLGGLSLLELNAILDEVIRQVTNAGLQIQYTLADSLLSSLDGPGFSITLFNLDDEIENLLKASTNAPSWPRNVHSRASSTAAGRCLQQENSLGKSTESFTKGIQGKLKPRAVHCCNIG